MAETMEEASDWQVMVIFVIPAIALLKIDSESIRRNIYVPNVYLPSLRFPDDCSGNLKILSPNSKPTEE
jgi:hypothetical protein